MVRKIILAMMLIAGISLPSHSQLLKWCKERNVADNLDVAFTLGTGGLGLELATPVTRWAQLRAGVEWLPSFHVPMTFDLTTYTDGLPSNNISEVQQTVYDMTGIEMDDKVRMIGKPTMTNFKLLVDVFPFQNNRHWHFTAGFYIGRDVIAKAVNDREEMPTLVGLNVYNRVYDYFENVSIHDAYLGGGNWISPDEVKNLKEKFRRYGTIGIHIGDFKDGEPYLMEPAPDGSVSARAIANVFKPYLGFGYSGSLDREKRWNVGFEAGALFWGGVPDVITHDGVNMTKDLVNVRGKVGDYVKLVKALPVYPMVSFRISYTLF